MRLPLTARIITFYSFKGGVGRSMALLNCAYVLAGLGRRVLMIDLDLEAPGLSYLIQREESQRRKQSGEDESEPLFRQGVVELVTAFAESPGDWPLARRADAQNIESYVSDLTVPETLIRGKDIGRLSVLPAGRIDREYECRLSAIPWKEEPLQTNRDNFFRYLRSQILTADMFDYVLVDARTGFSDEGYLATRMMADHLIVLSGMNQQNVLGTCQFVRQVQSWPQPESEHPRKLVLVLSPVPEWEEEAKQRRRAEMREIFEEELGTDVEFSVELPYHPRVAMWEEPIVAKWPHSSLAKAYEQLCQTIRGLTGDVTDRWVAWVEEAVAFDLTMSDAEIQQAADELSSRVAEAAEEVPHQALALSSVLRRVQVAGAKAWDEQRMVAAERLYRLYVEISDMVSSKFDLWYALSRHGGACSRLGMMAAARVSHERSLRAAEHDQDRRGRSHALLDIASLDRLTGNYAEARSKVDESLAIYRELGDRQGIAVALHELGVLDRLAGDYAEARSKVDESLAIYRELGDRRGIADTLDCLGVLDRLTGNYAEARSRFDESLAIKRELGDRQGIAVALDCLGVLDCLTGNYAEARSRFDESLAIKRELGERQGIDLSLDHLGDLDCLTGDYAEARSKVDESLAIKRELGDRRGIANTLHALANLDRLIGNYAEARSKVDESLAIYRELGERQGIAVALHELGVLDRLIGNYDEARSRFDESLAIKRELGDRQGIAVALHELGVLDRLAGDYAKARSKFDESLAIDRELGDRRGIAVTALYRAACDAQLEGPSGLASLREAIDLSLVVGDPTVTVRGLRLLGAALIHCQQTEDALHPLEHAVAGCRRFGLRGHLADSEALQAIAYNELGHEEQAITAARSAVAFFDEQHVKSPYRDQLDRLLTTATG